MTTPHSPRIAFWAAFSRVLPIAIFAQSFFAGVFLSGKIWGRDAHRMNATILVTVTLIAGVVALITLRSISNGKRLAFSMLGLGVALLIQMMIGQAVANGERLLWLHIPFGVAIIGFSAGLFDVARKLGTEPVRARERRQVAAPVRGER